MRALVFANGDANDGPQVRRAIADAGPAPLRIAADGGAHVAAFFGILPDCVIGDMDSLRPDELAQLAARGATIIRHPPEKDATDLELALIEARGRGACWMRVLGAIGDRVDQVLANIALLSLPALASCDIQLVAGRQSLRWVASGQHTLAGQPGDTLSLLPMAGDAHQIRTEGLRYPLVGESLHYGPARGVSNVFTGERVRISIGHGGLLAIHTDGRA
jgi:thiamine pyrophosphokinase